MKEKEHKIGRPFQRVLRCETGTIFVLRLLFVKFNRRPSPVVWFNRSCNLFEELLVFPQPRWSLLKEKPTLLFEWENINCTVFLKDIPSFHPSRNWQSTQRILSKTYKDAMRWRPLLWGSKSWVIRLSFCLFYEIESKSPKFFSIKDPSCQWGFANHTVIHG